MIRIIGIGVAAVFTLGVVTPYAHAGEFEALRAEMRALKARVVELEAKLEQVQRKEVEREVTWHSHASRDHGGFNLDIGHDHSHLDIHSIQVHGGMDWRYVDVQGSKHKMFLHEVELGLGARLTDWLEALVSVTKHDGEEVEIEQAYGKLKLEKQNMQARIGQFFVNFGPENREGFFNRRTVTPSAMRSGFFGHDNWSDQGVELSYKLPVTFESIVTAAALNGNNAKTFGDGSDTVDNNNIIAAFNAHNVVGTDWGRWTLGGSYAHGKWDADDKYSVDLFGLDSAWKFKNVEIQGEYMFRKKGSATGDIKGSGFYVLGAYTWPMDWRYLKDIELLFSYGESNPEKVSKERRYSPQLTFGLTETAKVRFLYDFRREGPVEVDNDRFIAQFAYHF